MQISFTRPPKEKCWKIRPWTHTEYVYQRTVSPEQAPDTPEYVEVGFEGGDAVSINGEKHVASDTFG